MNISAEKISHAESVAAPVVLIRPSKGWMPINVYELWKYRELLYFFVWRDIKVRYKQTIFGLAWAVIQPLSMMLVFTLFFGILAKIPSGGVPYPLFTYVALVPWTLFASSVTRASNILVQDANVIQKVYFPRLIMPIASILSPLVDFVIAFCLLLGLMLYFGYIPSITMLWLPLFLIMEIILALGLGLWLSAINVEYRDVSFVLPFLIQLGLFASPVIYSSDFVPQRFQVAYGLLNPMSGIIEGFRWAVLGGQPPNYLLLAASAVIIGVILVTGIFYFRKHENVFADVV